MNINTLITRLRDIAWDFPPEHSINRAADMLTVLQAENNKLQDELRRREAEIARLNEAREIANEKAREYEKKYQELGNLDRLRELAEADKEGRCVVLPCKLHTNLFIIDNNQVNHVVVESFHQWTSGCWKLSAHTDKEFQHWKGYEIGFEAIGKTIFLTREAAEAALKEREQNE